MTAPTTDGFGPDHLPYGVFVHDGGDARVGARLGDDVIDLGTLATATGNDRELYEQPTLDALLAAGPKTWAKERDWLTSLLSDEPDHVEHHRVPLAEVTLRMPFTVADYVDFYASLDHASNVGRIFRPDQEPLLPNWRHLPVGYHGRSGTIVPSGTDIPRPQGQRKAPADDSPTFGPSERLDIEAELGFVVGKPSKLGKAVATSDFAKHVFGVFGLNDWSARDIQAWEYVPLGPFLGKSFATSISAWVTPLAALADAWTPLPGQDPTPLPYLADGDPQGLDIDVEVILNGETVSRPPYRTMYWAPSQMLAHMTVNGASLRTGDVFASGTVSGPDKDQRGSFLELSWGGKEPFGSDGHTFLRDGDQVTLRYSAPGTAGGRITLGEVSGRILPASD